MSGAFLPSLDGARDTSDSVAFCYACRKLSKGEAILDHQLIKQIHNTPGRIVLAITGGGSEAISRLLTVPGASRTLIEATVPYDSASLADYIGGEPDQACSEKTARAMAMAAFQRARRYASGTEAVAGIGCTAALTTDRDRRGHDRAFVAVQTLEQTQEYALTLSREQRDRPAQESLCATTILSGIAGFLGVSTEPPAMLAGEALISQRAIGEPAWQSLFGAGPRSTQPEAKPKLVFPGAFNPIHDGHRRMIEIAEKLTGHRVLLEISAFNVDKPPLDYIDMHARSDRLREVPFTFTNTPTFVEKSMLFPGAMFMVGMDTLVRICEPRYYHDNPAERDLAITRLAQNGIRFLVFGRRMEGRFLGLDSVALSGALRDICIAVPEDQFRMDISSTKIRSQTE